MTATPQIDINALAQLVSWYERNRALDTQKIRTRIEHWFIAGLFALGFGIIAYVIPGAPALHGVLLINAAFDTFCRIVFIPTLALSLIFFVYGFILSQHVLCARNALAKLTPAQVSLIQRLAAHFLIKEKFQNVTALAAERDSLIQEYYELFGEGRNR